MKRKEFLKKSIIAGALSSLAPTLVAAKPKTKEMSTYDKLMQKVGFNHLPNKENKMSNKVIHRADSRGQANMGWLQSRHTFSFANYYNPERMHFGVLRVLNDDQVAPGRGFGRHPHDNMEIISIPLSGDLEHKDSMGNTAIIRQGDIQVMSAGTGIYHSEYNKNKDKGVAFLQIWVFPDTKNVTPRYDQIQLKDISKNNEFYTVLSPDRDKDGVWIHQNAWFSLGEFDQELSQQYRLHDANNGVYAFVIEGQVEIDGEKLGTRDGMGLWNTASLDIKTSPGSRVLLMEIPMQA